MDIDMIFNCPYIRWRKMMNAYECKSYKRDFNLKIRIRSVEDTRIEKTYKMIWKAKMYVDH